MNENVVLDADHALGLLVSLGYPDKSTAQLLEIIDQNKDKGALDIVNLMSSVPLRDKAGTFIGARMGRPEKAKMRKLTGSPHCLFPVGNEGGRLRCFQSALEEGKITAE